MLGEVLHERLGDEGRGHAEAAGGGGFHGLADVVNFFGPGFLGEVVGFAVESFGEALGADAAGEALAAAFVGEEGHGVVGGFDHVAGVIEDHDAAGPEERSVRADAGIVEGEVVEDLVSEESAGKPGHGDSLHGAPFERTTGPVVEESFQWKSNGDFVIAGAFDVAGEGDEFGAGVFAESEGLIPVGAVIDDVGNGAESFDVVDGGGFVLESVRDREGRLVAREGMFAFEGIEERSFFSANVSTCSAADVKVEGEAAIEDVVAEKACFEEFGEATFEEGVGLGVFVTEVDESPGRASGKASDDHAFEEGIRIVVHEGAILEATRFAFVGVTDDGFGMAVAVGDGFPFESGRKASSPASGEFGSGDGFDNAFGRGVTENFLESVEASVGLIAFESVVAFLSDVGEKAFFVFARVGSGKRRRRGFEIFCGGSGESGVAGEDRDGFVAATGTGHFGGGLALGFEGFENFVSASHAADVAGAYAGCFEAARSSGEVMVESDGAVEIGEGSF